MAVFSGKWAGVHENGRERILVVERITSAGEVSVLHGWDDLSSRSGFDSRRYTGRFENNVLTFGRNDDLYEFSVVHDNMLRGLMFRNGAEQRWGAITMRRVPDVAGDPNATTEVTPARAFLSSIEMGTSDPSLPPASAALMGKWEGRSKSGLYRVLAVKWITGQGDASVVQAWDDPSARTGYRARYHFVARAENGVLWLYDLNERYEFTVAPDGSLKGKTMRGDMELPEEAIVMTRVD